MSFLETVIGWESFDEAVRLRDILLNIIKETESQAIIDRLRQVVIAVDEIKEREKSGKFQEMIYWNKWRWRLVYNLKRMEKRYSEEQYPGVRENINLILNQLITHQTPANKQPVMEWLQLSVRWAEFLTRSKTND